MLSTTPMRLVVTDESVTVAMTTPTTTKAIAAHSIRVSRLPVTRHCTAMHKASDKIFKVSNLVKAGQTERNR